MPYMKYILSNVETCITQKLVYISNYFKSQRVLFISCYSLTKPRKVVKIAI